MRLSTFRQEVRRLGLDRDEELCRAGELTIDDGYRTVTEILAMERPPTALIAGNNQLFAGMFAALRDLRISIPQDLSVVACEDTELTALHNPPLDVVRRSLAELGARRRNCSSRGSRTRGGERDESCCRRPSSPGR